MSSEVINEQRLSGVLLHVTSLPSYGGIGDFGPAAYAFVDFLVQAKQRLWQVLPAESDRIRKLALFGAVGLCGQSFADQPGEPGRGWLACQRSVSAGLAGHDGPVDFERAKREKLPLIEEAAANFLDHAPDTGQGDDFRSFRRTTSPGLPTMPCSRSPAPGLTMRAGISGRRSSRIVETTR